MGREKKRGRARKRKREREREREREKEQEREKGTERERERERESEREREMEREVAAVWFSQRISRLSRGTINEARDFTRVRASGGVLCACVLACRPPTDACWR